MSEFDILEERCNIQEKLLLKARKDLIKARSQERTPQLKGQVTSVIKYLNEYKLTGKVAEMYLR